MTATAASRSSLRLLVRLHFVDHLLKRFTIAFNRCFVASHLDEVLGISFSNDRAEHGIVRLFDNRSGGKRSATHRLFIGAFDFYEVHNAAAVSVFAFVGSFPSASLN